MDMTVLLKTKKGLPVFEPSIERLMSGERPETVELVSELNGGPDGVLKTTTVLTVDYEEELTTFSHGLFEIGGIGTFRTGAFSVPRTHREAAPLAGYAIFLQDFEKGRRGEKKRRAYFRGVRWYGPRPKTRTTCPLFLVRAEEPDGETVVEVFRDRDIVDLWVKLEGMKVLDIREMTAREAVAVLREESSDSVTRKGLIDEATENAERLLHFIGSLMDWVGRGERAKEQLKGLGLEKKWTQSAWDHMWKGVSGQKLPEF